MNIAEMLKSCPKGTKLYSTVFGEVIIIKIDMDEKYPIIVSKLDGTETSFTKEGRYVDYPKSECVIFPSKDQRDWSQFRIPIKRGDIMMEVNGEYAFIANGKFEEHNWPVYICGITDHGTFITNDKEDNFGWIANFYIPASEEAKKRLFNKMAEAGYRWNADTLELEKIESKFKEGDVIIDNQGNLCLVSEECNNSLITPAILYADNILMIYNSGTIKRNIQMATLASIKDRNKLFSALTREGYEYDKYQHKLIKQEFKPFEKVLVRDDTNKEWSIDLFSYYDKEDKNFPYVCMYIHYRYCIPYKGNEYLLGTKDSPTYVDKEEYS